MKSDNVKKGMQQAPHRSLFNALGFTEEEMNKPMVGIVSSYNEIVPGHMNLDKIVNAVKLGVAEAGGVPVVFPAIAVCDGIAMGHIGMKYSLVTRDLIADPRNVWRLHISLMRSSWFRTAIRMSGTFDGCSAHQCTHSVRVRRTDACRTCTGQKAQPLFHV